MYVLEQKLGHERCFQKAYYNRKYPILINKAELF